MSDSDNKNQEKGFKGLQSLRAKSPESPSHPGRKVDTPALPPAWEDDPDPQAAQPQPTQSQTAAPSWRGWVIGIGILGAIVLFFIWAGSQQPSSSYFSPTTTYAPSATSTTVDAAAAANEVTKPAAPPVSMPPVGDGLVLNSEQIRYCVYEDRRIQGAKVVVDNYNQSSVDMFNAMVSDFNSRCGHYQYRRGALEPIETEAFLIQEKLEEEGKARLTVGLSQTVNESNIFDSINASESPTIGAAGVNPKFKDYPGRFSYTGPRAHPYIVSEFDRSFRTRIFDTMFQPVNFGGEYVISTWGCGTSCQMGVAVNARTGTSIPLPGSVCCWEGEGNSIIYRPDSLLLVLGGQINERGVYGTHFYELKNDVFVHLITVPIEKPAEQSPTAAPETEAANTPDSMTSATGGSVTYQTSFDCTKAHSISEYLICHDPMLSNDDRELAQLYLQAKASVTDSARLTERMRKQWNYREKNCRDKRCLSDWYVSQKDVMRKIAHTGDVYAE